MDVVKIAGASGLSAQPGSMPGLPREPGFSSSSEPVKLEKPGEVEGSEAIATLVERLRTQVQNVQRDLNFSVDDSTGEVVVQVIDGESGRVVRQIPSEEILRLTERLDEMRSLMFDTKA